MKKGLTKSLSLFILAGLMVSCEDENLNINAANQFVVEAFIFANEPVDDVKIKTTFPLVDTEDTSSPINNAEVVLIKDDDRYHLQSINNDGFYGYPGGDLTVNQDDVFQLEVTHDGIVATAETTVPEPTTGLELSKSEIIIPKIGFGGITDGDEIRTIIQNSTIEITWDSDSDDLFYAVIKTIEDELDPIFPAQVADRLRQFEFISEPTRNNSITFQGIQIESYGIHSVKVYRINEEYAALFDNQEQDSRDLNEPPSNVRNALGVFSAFNSQEVFFDVRRN